MNFTIVTTFSTNPQINNILSFTCDGCGDGVGVASDMRGHSSGRHGGKRADGALSLACGGASLPTGSRSVDYMAVSLLDLSPIGEIYFIPCFDPYDMVSL